MALTKTQKPFSISEYCTLHGIPNNSFNVFLINFFQKDYRRPELYNDGNSQIHTGMNPISTKSHKALNNLTGDLLPASRSYHEATFKRINQSLGNQELHSTDAICSMIIFNFEFVVRLIQALNNKKTSLESTDLNITELDRADYVINIKEELTLCMGHAYKVYQQHLNGEIDLSEITSRFGESMPYDELRQHFVHIMKSKNADILMQFNKTRIAQRAYHSLCGMIHEWVIEELFNTP